jgi:hypothetical protein
MFPQGLSIQRHTDGYRRREIYISRDDDSPRPLHSNNRYSGYQVLRFTWLNDFMWSRGAKYKFTDVKSSLIRKQLVVSIRYRNTVKVLATAWVSRKAAMLSCILLVTYALYQLQRP